MERKFTIDWFYHKIPAWNEHIVPRFKDLPDVRWLEIGVYEGRSAFWALDNVLQGPGALLYCLDRFSPDVPYLSLWAPNLDYEAVFDANADGDLRVVKLKGRSQEILPTIKELKLHGAHIDGDHSKSVILLEAGLVWDMLLPGGVLVFDDYGYEPMPEAKEAIDEFLAKPEVHHQVLFKGFQAIVLKLE
jgi:predicted O-methyltransferase YrrM